MNTRSAIIELNAEAAPEEAPEKGTRAAERSGDSQPGFAGEGNIDEHNTQLYPGQWRLARIETVNWGTFSGYHSLDVPRKGLLITGESGSGKSSLLDAVTMVLTPARNRHFNAAARTGSSRGEDRTVESYMRGAWRHETDAAGDVASTYLREGSVWSGIMLRYECGVDPNRQDRTTEPVNLLALFYLKAGSNKPEGRTSLYAVVRGNHVLTDFQEFAVGGLDSVKLKKAYAKKGITRVHREFSQFTSQFRKIMGIQSDKTLELLHKTQAAKNFGSLDDLFRRFMLERPETFKQAERAAEQFGELDAAHQAVVAQRRQRDALEPLNGYAESYRIATQAVQEAQRLQRALGPYTEQCVVERLRRERERSLQACDQAQERVVQLEREAKAAADRYNAAQGRYIEAGGEVLESANKDVLTFQAILQSVQGARSELTHLLSSSKEAALPDTRGQWEALRRSLEAEARTIQEREQADRDKRVVVSGGILAARSEGERLEKELRHLRQRGTNIPANLDEIRRALAACLGMQPADLPFVGELLSVREGQENWHGAIERLLGNQAKTLLVPRKAASAAARFAEERHLGVRFEFESVSTQIEVPAEPLSEASVVKKLEVASHARYPEFTAWVARFLRERCNYQCVDSPEELAHHKYALTRGGQIKRGNRYIKDDRHPLEDRSRWVLGSDNAAKIESLEARLDETARQVARGSRELLQLESLQDGDKNIVKAATVVAQGQWENYDERRARQDLKDAQAHYDLIERASHQRIHDAKAEQKRALEQRDAAARALDLARADLVVAQKEEARFAQSLEVHEGRLAQELKSLGEDAGGVALLAACAQELDKRLRAALRSLSAGSSTDESALYQAQNVVAKKLSESIASEERKRSRVVSDVERTLHEFRAAWPVVAADLSESFADMEAYQAIYQRIVATGLPEYEERFLAVLNDFSKDQITVIATTISQAQREVRERLEPVNDSLAMSEYRLGIRLRIKSKDNRSRQTRDFLAELKAITSGTLGNTDDLATAEERYHRTRRVIEKFSLPDYRRWRDECLDTRMHVSFQAEEVDAEGEVVNVYASDAGLSGGQKQKLVIFCLAAALRYQLADEQQPVPSYGTVVLDEAFDKADWKFAVAAMDVFEAFGFHMVLATPLKLLQTLEPYVGGMALVRCENERRSTVAPITYE